jgi:hypothetical protein
MRAVFLDFGTVSNGDLDPGPLERALPGILIHDRSAQADVPKRIAGFEAVLANKSVIDGATIRANPTLPQHARRASQPGRLTPARSQARTTDRPGSGASEPTLPAPERACKRHPYSY